MNRRLAAVVLAGGAFGVSAAMSVLIAFVPFAYEGVDAVIEGSEEVPETFRESAVGVNGWWVVSLIFIHPAAALYFFSFVSRAARGGSASRLVAYSFPAGLFLYSLATMFTWGLWYAPVAGLALASAIVLPKQAPDVLESAGARTRLRQRRRAGRRRKR